MRTENLKKLAWLGAGTLAFWTCGPAGMHAASDALESAADWLQPDASASGDGPGADTRATDDTSGSGAGLQTVLTADGDRSRWRTGLSLAGPGAAPQEVVTGPLVVTFLSHSSFVHLSLGTECTPTGKTNPPLEVPPYGENSRLFIPEGMRLCLEPNTDEASGSLRWSGYIPY